MIDESTVDIDGEPIGVGVHGVQTSPADPGGGNPAMAPPSGLSMGLACPSHQRFDQRGVPSHDLTKLSVIPIK